MSMVLRGSWVSHAHGFAFESPKGVVYNPRPFAGPYARPFITQGSCPSDKPKPVKNILTLLTVMTVTAVMSGCAQPRPLLAPPGTVQQQQYSASVHDPYADNDAGPDVVGSRPREFQRPLAEPVRNRWLRDSWWNR
jgi:hypothetical protein